MGSLAGQPYISRAFFRLSPRALNIRLLSGCVLADAYNFVNFCIVLLCSLALVLYILRMIRRILKAALHFKLAV